MKIYKNKDVFFQKCTLRCVTHCDSTKNHGEFGVTRGATRYNSL